MRVRLYLDEDSMWHSLVRALRVRGVDVATPLDAGTVGYDDSRQLEWAEREGRVLARINISFRNACSRKETKARKPGPRRPELSPVLCPLSCAV
jgi:hypothetical protein